MDSRKSKTDDQVDSISQALSQQTGYDSLLNWVGEVRPGYRVDVNGPLHIQGRPLWQHPYFGGRGWVGVTDDDRRATSRLILWT
jgi:hypothetical protein